MAKIQVVHSWGDDKMEFDYEDIVELIRDPMCIADENNPEQEAYLREHGRDFVRNFVSSLQDAIEAAETYGSEVVPYKSLDIYIPGGEWILFREEGSHRFACNLDTERLRELLSSIA
jgi:hypothetical protein